MSRSSDIAIQLTDSLAHRNERFGEPPPPLSVGPPTRLISLGLHKKAYDIKRLRVLHGLLQRAEAKVDHETTRSLRGISCDIAADEVWAHDVSILRLQLEKVRCRRGLEKEALAGRNRPVETLARVRSEYLGGRNINLIASKRRSYRMRRTSVEDGRRLTNGLLDPVHEADVDYRVAGPGLLRDC